MRRHRFHGDWNYTLRPATSHSTSSASRAADPPSASLDCVRLGNPALTGMTHQQLDNLVSQLAPALAHQREQSRRRQRGGERLRAAGAGAKDKLVAADRILATVLCLRELGTHELLGQLFGVDTSAITRAINQIRPLPEQHGHRVPASTARLRTPADVTAFLASEDVDLTDTDATPAS